MNEVVVIDDPNEYGSKGQTWAPEFVDYMVSLVTSPVYKGMPDAIKSDGKIQWEAPSNRSGGQYQFTHNKRRDWWVSKAKSLGLDTSKDQWISRTAKAIHPTGEKPCKRCGNTMFIAYVYPQANLIKRFKKYLGDDFEISGMEPIHDVVQRAYDDCPDALIGSIPNLLGTKTVKVPDFSGDLDAVFSWLDNEYIPGEPTLLSPGVMSNAPDRFDGFHSFNRCCRGKADTGRHTANLRTYSTDRRVFEYWSEGDWIAADKLMGLVKSKFRHELSEDGGDGPPTADHIGPLSLGFCHRPEFKLLSKGANSAKNNRMSLSDVRYLMLRESEAIKVASWYAQPLWDLRKSDVDDDEKALRLSKMMRDNQRLAMSTLCRFFKGKYYSFLLYLLELPYADRNVEFKNLRAEKYITVYDELITVPRKTKYTLEQKARRIRIGFEALRSYTEKNNRHSFELDNDTAEAFMANAISELGRCTDRIKALDLKIHQGLISANGNPSETFYREVAEEFSDIPSGCFDGAKTSSVDVMSSFAKSISQLWDHDRYVRAQFEDDV